MASPTFSGTVVGGIQDVSALLPLLGTEQCEKHVGSALDRGFLYSSITPISIFGSLGIVRAAFNILIASLSIQHYRFLGAKKLNDGGFGPSGEVAPMIALDPRHPKRFLAESRLEAMLDDEHIENVEDLTVSLGQGVFWWNITLVSFSSVIATAGLLPYILIIRNSQHSRPAGSDKLDLFPSGWGFPVVRILGSALCVIAAQVLMQIRILVLLKTRLLFITIDRLAKEANIDLELAIHTRTERNCAHEEKQYWSADVASEKCIWALQRWLAIKDRKRPAHPTEDLESQAHPAEGRENQDHSTKESKIRDHRQKIGEIYKTEYKRQLESMNKFVPLWFTPVLGFTLVVGIAFTIGGYIGCFYLIQHSTNDTFGPLVWLILEAFLSVIRILVWALNPSWDDSKGIVFKLQLAPHSPLITCNMTQQDITEDGLAPIARANNFLEDIVPYTGPLPLFDANDVALYYIFTAESADLEPQSDNAASPVLHGLLYVVISAYKEQTSRILVKEKKGDPFSIYISTLKPVPGSTAINVKVTLSKEGETEPKTHFFTADARFMGQLESHYDELLSQLSQPPEQKSRKAPFGKTWAMQRPSEKQVNKAGATQADQSRIILMPEDIAYLRQGQVERRRRYMCRQLEEWIELYVELFTKELFQDVPVDLVFEENESVSVVQKYEANEAEYLLMECWTFMEWLLMDTTDKWDEYVREHHKNMVDSVVSGIFTDKAKQYRVEGIRKGKLIARLEHERENLIEKERLLYMENLHNRFRRQANSTQRRIHGRKYNDSKNEEISAEWDTNVLQRVAQKPCLPPFSIRVLLTNDVESDEMRGRSSATAFTGKFEGVLEERLAPGLEEIKSEDKSNQKNQFDLMKGRCSSRADRLFSGMNYQRAAFKELQSECVLTGNAVDLVMYWSTASLQERRRLLDRNQKYLRLSDNSIKAVGGRKNMIRALSKSQNFEFIDASESTLLTADDILSVLKNVKSIRGVAFCGEAAKEEDIAREVKRNVEEAISEKQNACLYENVVVTDYYRKGCPYLRFNVPGSSSCTVTFHVHEKRDHIITLRHCQRMTKANGKIDIKLNDYSLKRTGQSQAVKLKFIDEDIKLPAAYLFAEKPNVLTTLLVKNSAGVYWLSDVLFPTSVPQASGSGSADLQT